MKNHTMMECLKLISPDCGKKIYIIETAGLAVLQIILLLAFFKTGTDVSEIQLTTVSSLAFVFAEIVIAYISTGGFASGKGSYTIFLRTSSKTDKILRSAYKADEIRRLIISFFIAVLNFTFTASCNSDINIISLIYTSVFSIFSLYISVSWYVYTVRRLEKTYEITLVMLSLPFVYMVLFNLPISYILIHASPNDSGLVCALSIVIAAVGEKLILRSSLKNTLVNYYGGRYYG